MDQLIQSLIIGLADGLIFALVALGYTLVSGIIELINFAHGDVFMIGTMLALTILTTVPALFGVPQPALLPPGLLLLLVVLTMVACMVACGALNAPIERVAYRPLRRAPRLAHLISAIGVSFILVNVGLHWKGASPVDFPNLLPSVDILRDVLHLDTAVRFTTKDLLIIVVSLPLVYGLRLFIF